MMEVKSKGERYWKIFKKRLDSIKNEANMEVIRINQLASVRLDDANIESMQKYFINFISIADTDFSTCMKFYLKFLLCFIRLKKREVEESLIYSCYISAIVAFIEELRITEVNNENMNKALDFVIEEQDYKELIEYDFNYRQFCEDPNCKLNDCILDKVFEFIKNCEIDIEDRPLYYRDLWYLKVCDAIEFYFKKKQDFNELNIYRRLYDSLQPSPVRDKRIAIQEKLDYIDKTRKEINTKVFGDDALLIDDLYCPINVSLTNRFNRIIDGLDFSGDDSFLGEWLQRQSCGLIILQGEPGCGKTTIMKHTALELLKKGYVVFYLDLDNLTNRDNSSMLNDINFSFAKNKYFFKLTNGFDSVNIAGIEALENAIFIFDALDEIVGREDFALIERFLNAVGQLKNDFRVLVSGRSYLFQSLRKMDVYRESYVVIVDELDSDNTKDILNKLSEKMNISITYKEIEQIDKDFLLSPLLLYLVCWVKKNNYSSYCVIKNKASLYELILEIMYKKEYNTNRKNNSTEDDKLSNKSIDLYDDISDMVDLKSYKNYKRSLQIIGFIAYMNELREVPYGLCEKYANFLSYKPFFYWMNREDEDKPYNLILQFFAHQKNQKIYFFHKTFYEFLAENELLDLIVNYDVHKDELSKTGDVKKTKIEYFTARCNFIFDIFNLLGRPHISLYEDSFNIMKPFYFINDIVSMLTDKSSYKLKHNLSLLANDLFNLDFISFHYDYYKTNRFYDWYVAWNKEKTNKQWLMSNLYISNFEDNIYLHLIIQYLMFFLKASHSKGSYNVNVNKDNLIYVVDFFNINYLKFSEAYFKLITQSFFLSECSFYDFSIHIVEGTTRKHWDNFINYVSFQKGIISIRCLFLKIENNSLFSQTEIFINAEYVEIRDSKFINDSVIKNIFCKEVIFCNCEFSNCYIENIHSNKIEIENCEFTNCKYYDVNDAIKKYNKHIKRKTIKKSEIK